MLQNLIIYLSSLLLAISGLYAIEPALEIAVHELSDFGDAQASRNIIFPGDNYQHCDLQLNACKPISNCPEVLQIWIYQNIEPKTCFFQGSLQYVCCPKQPTAVIVKSGAIQQRRSEAACQNFQSQRSSNIIFARSRRSLNLLQERAINPLDQRTAIVKGENTFLNEFPYMAALGWKNGDLPYLYHCGGVLIAPNYVLTSAHCSDVDGEAPEIVRIGGNNLQDKFAQQIAIKQIIVHPSYNHVDAYNDIALIELQHASTFRPACLWSESTTPHNNVTAIGYGNTKFAGSSSVDLLKAALNLISNEDCQKYYPSHLPSRLLPTGLLGTHICAGDPEHLRDTCQGDSGGPIILYIDDGRYKRSYVVGLTTMGQGCTGVPPSVYTRTNSFIDWIEDIVWPAQS